MVDGLSSLMPHYANSLLEQNVALAKTIVNLSLSCSDLNARYIERCSLIVERLSQQFNSNFTVEHKIELALFFNRHLSCDVSTDLVDNKM